MHVVAEIETLPVNPFDCRPVAPARELESVAGSLHEAPRLLDFLLYRSDRVPDLGSVAQEGKTPPARAILRSRRPRTDSRSRS